MYVYYTILYYTICSSGHSSRFNRLPGPFRVFYEKCYRFAFETVVDYRDYNADTDFPFNLRLTSFKPESTLLMEIFRQKLMSSMVKLNSLISRRTAKQSEMFYSSLRRR